MIYKGTTKIAGGVPAIVDNLNSTSATNVLSANQGKVLNDTKAPLAGPTFTGTVVLPSTTLIGNVSATEIGYVDGVTSAIQTQLNAKQATLLVGSATLASPAASITISNLDIATHGGVYDFTISASNASYNDIVLCKVGGYASNYSGAMPLLGATYNGTYVGNNAYCGWCSKDVFGAIHGTITLTNNTYNLTSISSNPSSMGAATNSGSISNITSLVFTITNGQNFATGTTIKIYRK